MPIDPFAKKPEQLMSLRIGSRLLPDGTEISDWIQLDPYTGSFRKFVPAHEDTLSGPVFELEDGTRIRVWGHSDPAKALVKMVGEARAKGARIVTRKERRGVR